MAELWVIGYLLYVYLTPAKFDLSLFLWVTVALAVLDVSISIAEGFAKMNRPRILRVNKKDIEFEPKSDNWDDD